MKLTELNNTSLKNIFKTAHAYYRMESGALTTDSSGNGYTLTNNNTVTLGTGIFGGSSDFGNSATNKFLSITTPTPIFGLGANVPISVSFWIKLNTEIAASTYGIFCHGDTSVASGILTLDYEYNSGTRRLRLRHGAASGTHNITLGTSNWYHIVVQRGYAGAGGSLWVNGAQVISGLTRTTTYEPGGDRFFLGTDNDGISMAGMIDDTTVFNYVLPSSEIALLYNSGTGREYEANRSLFSKFLKAYYRMESGALTTDSSGNGETLTNNNTVADGTGLFGGAADFGAANTNKSLSKAGTIGSITNGQITMMGWVRLNTEITSGEYEIFQHQNGTSFVEHYVRYQYNSGTRRIVFARNKANVTNQNFSYDVSLGVSDWHHIAYTFDGSMVRGYIDGAHIGSVVATGNGSSGLTDYFAIGGNSVVSTWASALIDDVGIFNAALTADQIKDAYEGRAIGETWPQTVDGKELAGANIPTYAAPQEIDTIYNGSSSLKGYYKLEADGTDSSGAAFTLTGTATPTFGSGKFGNAVTLNGSTQYLSAASPTHLNLAGSQTWTAWVKPDDFGALSVVASIDKLSSRGKRLYVNGTDGDMVFEVAGLTGATSITSDARLAPGFWNFVAGTYDAEAGKLSIFVNGIMKYSTSATGSANTPASTNFAIGIDYTSGSDTASGFFDGSLDDVAIFNRVLSEQELKQIYRVGTSLYYRFAETSGTSVADSSGNSSTGTASRSNILNNTGKFGNGAVFVAASSDKITITDNNILKPVGALTVGGWVKTTSSSNMIIFQSNSENTATAGIQLYKVGTIPVLYSGKNTGNVDGTDYDNANGTTNIEDGLWHFIVGTWDGSNLKLYVDGFLEGTTAWKNPPVYASTNYVRVGCRNPAGTDATFWDGSLDDVFLINGIALNSEQINELYYRGSIVGLWHLNSSGTDYSGNHYHLAETGSPTYTPGVFDRAITLNGTSQYAVISDASCPSLEIPRQQTWMAWVNMTNTAGVQRIMAKYDTTGTWRLLYTATDFRFSISTLTPNETVASGITANLGQWYHVAGVYDGSFIYIYVDGSLKGKAAATGAGADTDAHFALGASFSNIGDTADNFFNGKIEEAIMFNRALSSREIKNYYSWARGKFSSVL